MCNSGIFCVEGSAVHGSEYNLVLRTDGGGAIGEREGRVALRRFDRVGDGRIENFGHTTFSLGLVHFTS